jgi:hypothetical protein
LDWPLYRRSWRLRLGAGPNARRAVELRMKLQELRRKRGLVQWQSN